MSKDINTPRTIEDLIRKYNFEKILGLTKNVENASMGVIKLQNELNNILTSLVINLSNILDSQSEVSLWFYSDTPTKENEPYILWENKEEHIGDICYVQNSGYVYQFNGEVWERNTDANLVSAMALTNVELDTTDDHERKVFFNTPIVPYSSGDWWIQEDGTLLICQLGKPTGEYEENDFINSSKYSATVSTKINDTITVLKGTVQEITEDYVKFTDLSTGGNTTIAGENISTGSIQSNNYVQNKSGTKINLLDGVIDTKGFKVDEDGNATVASIITDKGLISNFQFSSGNNFSALGFFPNYVEGELYISQNLNISVYIPENFTITEAKVILYLKPIRVAIDTLFWGYVRNVKLGKNNLDGVWTSNANETLDFPDDSIVEIPGAFGTNGYTPPTPSNTGNQGCSMIISGDIKDKLVKGINSLAIYSDVTRDKNTINGEKLNIEDGSLIKVCAKYTGYATAFVNIIGYSSYGGD